MTKHSHFSYTSTYSSTPHNTNRKHNIHHIHYTNTQHYFNTPRLKIPLFLTAAATQQTFPHPHTVTTTDIKTNMRHIYTSIASRHLATRGNNKILRTPPPHISRSKERLSRFTRRTLAQLRKFSLPQIILTQSRRQILSITTMPPLKHPHTRHTPSLQLHPHTHHTVTHGFVDRLCWTDGAAGQMERFSGWWTKSGMIGPPPHKQGSREWVDTTQQ